jgi:DNA polymerase-2
MQTQIEGFIFKGSSFDYNGLTFIKLYGQSNKGSFLVIVNQFQNYFFAESNQPTSFKSLDGYWVDQIFCSTQEILKQKSQEYLAKGLRVFESDIKPLDRYLMDNNFFSQVNISGIAKIIDGLLTFENPNIVPGHYYPDYKIMSFDIETGKNGKLLSLAYSFRSKELNEDKAIVLGDLKETSSVSFTNKEEGILNFFQLAVKRLDPDIFTGWNVVGFDFLFLFKKSLELKFPIKLGRNHRPLDMFQSARGEWFAKIEGRAVVDGPWAMKMNFFSFESFKLNSVAKELLGAGKDIDEDEVHDKWGEIERRFQEDKMSLAKYNIMDATLVLDIFEKVKLIDLLLTRSFISGMLIERVGGSTASFDHFYLPLLHKEGVVAPNVEDVKWARQSKGGFVLNPIVGIHSNVLVMDFKSLYPTIIQTFLIDPLSRCQSDVDSLTTPVGLKFSRTNHILPKKISELLERRLQAKKEENANLSQAVKILMNSFYGVMGSSGCRFYHEDLPDGITGSGQWILKTVIEYLEKRNLLVLYGDTDSIFVQLPVFEEFEIQANILVSEVNEFLTQVLFEKFSVESKLEIQYDKFFQKLILTSARGNDDGAKKRYAGLAIKIKDKEIVEEMVLTGMEYVRSDWSLLARNFQYELIRRVFKGENIQEYIDETLKKLEQKELDDQLILSKRLSKPLDEYLKNIPPHARAAKILYEKLGIMKKRPQYVMTIRGAIPIELPHSDIDYDYYLDRQIAPIANSILSLFGKSFEEMRGPQLSLF